MKRHINDIVQACQNTVNKRVEIDESPYRLCTVYDAWLGLLPENPCKYLGRDIKSKDGEYMFSCCNGRIRES
jgi:hypothetical protein